MTDPNGIHTIAVVIPARNEEKLLARALAALTRSIEHLNTSLGTSAPAVCVVVVLDRCTDSSAAIAAECPDLHVIVTDAGAVGAARRAGVRFLLGRAGHAPQNTWVATTDADSAVPMTWLTTQLACAHNGADLVLGTVLPDLPPRHPQHQRWARNHRIVEGHPYVHGANMGVRANRYVEAGEFPPTVTDEDVLLVGALRAINVRERRIATIPVLTSGRSIGRAPGGFAEYLQRADEPGIDQERVQPNSFLAALWPDSVAAGQPHTQSGPDQGDEVFEWCDS